MKLLLKVNFSLGMLIMKNYPPVITLIIFSLLTGCTSSNNKINQSQNTSIGTHKQENKMFVPKNEYEQGILNVALKDVNKAIFLVDKNIETFPNNIRSYYIRAIVYGYWGNKLKNKEYASLSWNDYTFCIDKAKSGEYQVSKLELAELYSRRGTMSMLGESYAQGIADYEISCQIKKQRCKGLDMLRVLFLKN